jgi:NADPH:quinone reductase
MKAWVCERFLDPYELSLIDTPVPDLGPGDVHIAMRAAGVAFGETLVMNGTYQIRPPLPYVPGSEISGVVAAVGAEVDTVDVGDEVMVASFGITGGGFAEIMRTQPRFLHRKPKRLTFAQGASLANNYFTAYHAFLRRGMLQPGETLVVHGASGAVGIAGVQIGKMMGATVIGTGSDDEKLKVASALGADHVVNVTREPMRERLLELTNGRGADVFLDPVGGDVFDLSMRAIAPGGRILVVGATSGRYATPRTNIVLVKMISIIGIEGRQYIENSNGVGTQDFQDMLHLIEAGRIEPYVGAEFPFEQLPEAFEHLLSRRSVGKVVLVNPAGES